jgi:hypothetical protein
MRSIPRSLGRNLGTLGEAESWQFGRANAA